MQDFLTPTITSKKYLFIILYILFYFGSSVKRLKSSSATPSLHPGINSELFCDAGQPPDLHTPASNPYYWEYPVGKPAGYGTSQIQGSFANDQDALAYTYSRGSNGFNYPLSHGRNRNDLTVNPKESTETNIRKNTGDHPNHEKSFSYHNGFTGSSHVGYTGNTNTGYTRSEIGNVSSESFHPGSIGFIPSVYAGSISGYTEYVPRGYTVSVPNGNTGSNIDFGHTRSVATAGGYAGSVLSGHTGSVSSGHTGSVSSGHTGSVPSGHTGSDKSGIYQGSSSQSIDFYTRGKR